MIIALLQAASHSTTANKIAENAQLFNEVDPIGIGMSVVGMVVVFASLLLLYILFMNITKVINRTSKENKSSEKVEKIMSGKSEDITGEINAAIALALHFYSREIRDQEAAILTINKVSRTYSPWSSKIYGLRQNPRR